MSKITRISQEEFEGHDCHNGPESSCQVCELWAVQLEREGKAVEASMIVVFGKNQTYA